ncbi:DUF4232 domain-containing protein [Lentzea sp. CC55]|uniref:DUF4232 domain-containing protein n=1 Tax=Lentzea sp. CC55 TaxID=2884909 RepID=UPI0027E0E739|nr:DUF4232 domain-containing protein [Lentzea sp. CC55]MCG8922556.1 DUF4232 domain-containing protein [Lentzea sp. CC55]
MLSLVVVLSAACGTAPGSEPESTSTTFSELAAEASRNAESVQQCSTERLRVHLGPGDNDMRGAHVPLRFTNTSAEPCTLQGAPGVSYVTEESGQQLGLPAKRHTDGPVVTVKPGETASAALFLSSAPHKTPGCEQVQAGGLRVYVPNGIQPRFVGHEGTACAAPLEEPSLEVGPVRPGADNTRI